MSTKRLNLSVKTVKQKEINTEQKILEAAKEVFQHKGMTGARMQEIADKAGINKAMLHYYYRNKQRLFDAVFQLAFKSLAPKVVSIIQTDEHLFDMIKKFTNEYITFMSKNSFIPSFVICELNRNPEILKNIISENIDASVQKKLQDHIKDLIEKKEIKPISLDQLFMDIISLCLFPILAKPLLATVLQKDKKEYQSLINERKEHVSNLIINAIKV